MNRPDLRLLATDRYAFAVSYSAADAAAVLPSVELLRQRGYRVFEYVDELARSWGEPLEAYLGDVFSADACCYVAFWSRHYRVSRWTLHEYESIQAEPDARSRLLVVRLDDSFPDSSPEHLAGQTVDACRDLVAADLCQQLAAHLASLEAWTEPGIAAEVRMVAAAAGSLDLALLEADLTAAGEELPDCRWSLRLPSDVRSLIAASDGVDNPEWIEKLARVERDEIPKIVEGLRLLARCGDSPSWSLDEVARALADYYVASCALLIRAFAPYDSVLEACHLDEPELLQLAGDHAAIFASGLAWCLREPVIPAPFWYDVDLFDDQRSLRPIRKFLWEPAIPSTEDAREPWERVKLVRCLAPQLCALAVRRPDLDLDSAAYLESPERIRLGFRNERILDPRTGEHDFKSNSGGRRLVDRIESSLRPTLWRWIEERRLERFPGRSKESTLERYLSQLRIGRCHRNGV